MSMIRVYKERIDNSKVRYYFKCLIIIVDINKSKLMSGNQEKICVKIK